MEKRAGVGHGDGRNRTPGKKGAVVARQGGNSQKHLRSGKTGATSSSGPGRRKPELVKKKKTNRSSKKRLIVKKKKAGNDEGKGGRKKQKTAGEKQRPGKREFQKKDTNPSAREGLGK